MMLMIYCTKMRTWKHKKKKILLYYEGLLRIATSELIFEEKFFIKWFTGQYGEDICMTHSRKMVKHKK